MKTIFISILIIFAGTAIAQPFTVGHTTITFNDASRSGGFGSGGGSGRQIQTEIYYPSDIAGEDVSLTSGEFPVIVFGHGFAMAWDAYENIWTELVPQGFIIAFPRTEGGLIPAPAHDEFGLDLALVETKLQIENTTVSSLFYNHVTNKSAIMGHSMGGGATFLAAESNSNITTVIGLAPAETSPSAVTAATNITVPALVFTADQDLVTPAIDHHIPIYNALNSSCKHLVNIIDGAHCYYANSNFNCDFGESTSGGSIGITRAVQQDIMFRYVLPWLRLYLYDDCDQHSVFETDLALDAEVTHLSSCSGFPIPTYDLNVSTTTTTLTSDQSGVSYQWLECDNSNAPAPGATNQSYSPTNSGNYAVVLGSGSCVDTSNCYFIAAVGIEEFVETINPNKELIMIIDLLGRETKPVANTPLIYIYSDGTRKRIIRIED
jgi:dienelactone hydrolase